MKSDSTRKDDYFLVPNFDALHEAEQEYRKTNKEDIRKFLSFWQEAYDLWKQKYSPYEMKYIEETVKIRKKLIEKFGFRT